MLKQAQPDVINRKKIQDLLASGEVEELKVEDIAAKDDSPAYTEVQMKIVHKEPGVLRPSAREEMQQQEVPQAVPLAAKSFKRLRKASKGLEEAYPPEFLKSMGL